MSPETPSGAPRRRDVPTEDRLICALDVPGPDEARRMVDTLGDAVRFYKLGLELFMAGGYFELVDWLLERDRKVFVDLKFFDIPATVGRAVARLAGRGVTFATVHGNQRMIEAACKAKGDLGILAVTVLTSLDQGDLEDLGFRVDVESLVLSRARRAFEAGCDGVITSGHEAAAIRAEVGAGLQIVMPGIRPVLNDRAPAADDQKPAADDQKRTVDIEEAFDRGADYLVVGRPIRAATDPRAAAEEIQRRIAAYFS